MPLEQAFKMPPGFFLHFRTQMLRVEAMDRLEALEDRVVSNGADGALEQVNTNYRAPATKANDPVYEARPLEQHRAKLYVIAQGDTPALEVQATPEARAASAAAWFFAQANESTMLPTMEFGGD